MKWTPSRHKAFSQLQDKDDLCVDSLIHTVAYLDKQLAQLLQLDSSLITQAPAEFSTLHTAPRKVSLKALMRVLVAHSNVID